MNLVAKGGIGLNKVPQIQSIDIDVPGWVSPLTIHYGIYSVGAAQYILWKIAGTSHTFRVPAKIVFQQHNLEIKEHFILTLKQFRKDYINWKNEGFPEDWQKEYYNIFSDYIITNGFY